MAECWQCGSENHFISQCPQNSRPPAAAAAQPPGKAATYAEHLERVNGYVDLWAAGQLSLWQKRHAIAGENMQWYGRQLARNGISLTTP